MTRPGLSPLMRDFLLYCLRSIGVALLLAAVITVFVAIGYWAGNL